MRIPLSIMIAALLGLTGLHHATGQERLTGVRIVAKPASKKAQATVDLFARTQPTVPEGWREIPFEETAPEPELTAPERDLGFMLFQRPITEPVYPNTRPRADERLQRLDVFAAPGEIEPVAFGVYSVRNLANFRVRVSPLRSESSGAIPASAVDVRLVTCWNIRYPSYQSTDTYRCQPELLEKVTAHSSPAGECRQWWLRIRVPEKARPGVYHATVTVYDDNSARAASIPLRLRVLGFRLKKDPDKRYSAYYYPQQIPAGLAPAEKARREKLVSAEYRAMAEYGLDMFPTFSLSMNPGGRVELPQAGAIERMRQAGFRGPVPVTADRVVRALYDSTTSEGVIGAHWSISKLPPESFYTLLTQAVMRFERERKAKNWPEFIYCPVDEVDAAAGKFGSRVYAAFGKAGVRTYITKDPRNADAAAYVPHVDFWCSQPFAAPYEKAIAGKPGYWCYPNHVAGEIKDHAVMRRGGRMTYGFGFWRSGYAVLIPWHWRWQAGPDPFDYLRGSSSSGCGNRLDENGELIPATYWECFREGMDDARYLYTLQSALAEREGAGENTALGRLVKEGHDLLQEIWSSIQVRDRYLDTGFRAPDDFDHYRWRLARLTERLYSYPARRKATAPSAPVKNTSARAAETPPLSFGADDEIFDLGSEDFTRWTSGTAEGIATVLDSDAARGEKALRFLVAVDHKRDGGEGGKYPVGWPRLVASFPEGALDLTRWDLLAFRLRAASAGGNDPDAFIPFTVNARAHAKGTAADLSLNAGGHAGEWTPYSLSIADLIGRTGGTDAWKSLRTLQFGLAESRYAHGDSITLDLDDISLVRLSSPRLRTLRAPRHLVPNQPDYIVTFGLLGASAEGSRTVRAALLNRAGKAVAQSSGDLARTRRLALDAAGLPNGKYRLAVTITDASGKVCSEEAREVLGVRGW
ncbi:MAG: hypothetical protein ACYC9O_05705 [Candidatus Latescibacterota bacterium]